MKLVCSHRIPLSADAFWSLLHEDPYESQWAAAIGLRAYRELERSESAGENGAKLAART